MLRQAVDADGDSFKFQGLSVQSTSGSVLYFAGSWDRAHLLHSPALTELLLPAFKMQSPILVPVGWVKSTASGFSSNSGSQAIARYSEDRGLVPKLPVLARPACRGPRAAIATVINRRKPYRY